MADTHVNAYRAEHQEAQEALIQAQGRVRSTGEALDAKLAEIGEPAEYQPKKSKKESKPSEEGSDAPVKVKSVGVKKESLLQIAKDEGVEGVSKDNTVKEIAAAINAKRGAE